jgi:hypothetical protein
MTRDRSGNEVISYGLVHKTFICQWGKRLQIRHHLESGYEVHPAGTECYFSSDLSGQYVELTINPNLASRLRMCEA